MTDKNGIVHATFYLTYVCLITTGTITLIEALRTKNAAFRHVMNLETCVSIVAAFFYSMFTELAKQDPLPYAEINKLRYIDWFITTPMMLLALCIVMSMERKESPRITVFAVVLALDLAMLSLGYMGETGTLDRRLAWTLSTGAFVALFGFLWASGRPQTFASKLSYFTFLSVWSVYGLVYFLDEQTKNTIFNVLDLLAKALVGIFFWMYFGHVLQFDP